MAVPAVSREGTEERRGVPTQTGRFRYREYRPRVIRHQLVRCSPNLNSYYLADRSNKAVDVIHSGSSTVTHQFTPGFVGARSTCVDNSTTPPTNTGILCSAASPCSGAQVCTGNNDVSGPDGVLTVDHKELWVGDGDSRVWVLDPTTGAWRRTAGAPNPISRPAPITKEPMRCATIQLIIW